ncbi:hypothetical protein BF49_2536 [Bradyrhizobium sp.]|nr:hypothetical protein BF49_2536 [Bradyrhizobium sp.]
MTSTAKAGCSVNNVGADWTPAGSFVPTEPKSAKKAKRRG